MSGGILSETIISAPTIYIGVKSPVWTNENQKKIKKILAKNVDIHENS